MTVAWCPPEHLDCSAVCARAPHAPNSGAQDTGDCRVRDGGDLAGRRSSGMNRAGKSWYHLPGTALALRCSALHLKFQFQSCSSLGTSRVCSFGTPSDSDGGSQRDEGKQVLHPVPIGIP